MHSLFVRQGQHTMWPTKNVFATQRTLTPLTLWRVQRAPLIACVWGLTSHKRLTDWLNVRCVCQMWTSEQPHTTSELLNKINTATIIALFFLLFSFALTEARKRVLIAQFVRFIFTCWPLFHCSHFVYVAYRHCAISLVLWPSILYPPHARLHDDTVPFLLHAWAARKNDCD